MSLPKFVADFDITRPRPAGCSCEIVNPLHGACLTCTCPLDGCGAYGRFGSPIPHKSTCAGE